MTDHRSNSDIKAAPATAHRWWSNLPRERYWLESTDRPDIGADLKAPLLDAKGSANWRYCLFREAKPGDVVFHYDKNRRAITARSIIAGGPEPRRIEWVARGTSARSRQAVLEEVDGYWMPLATTDWLPEPLTLQQLRTHRNILEDVAASLQEARPIYFPLELSNRPVRPLQGYAFKLPAAFVDAFSQLSRQTPSPTPRVPWADEELATCVDTYVGLLARQARRDHPNYAQVVRGLAEKLGRRKGAIDRRMQAISLVLTRLNQPRVARFPPGQSLTRGVERRLAHLLELRLPTADPQELEKRTLRVRRSGTAITPPGGNNGPAESEVYQGRRFRRRADIKAWVLNAADRNCEACDSEAPFVGLDGFPFLEVHHLRPLAEGGPDSICNAVGVCPNCHRRLHLGADKDAYRSAIINRIERLRDYEMREIVSSSVNRSA